VFCLLCKPDRCFLCYSIYIQHLLVLFHCAMGSGNR